MVILGGWGVLMSEVFLKRAMAGGQEAPLGPSLISYRHEPDKSDSSSHRAPTDKTDNDKTDDTTLAGASTRASLLSFQCSVFEAHRLLCHSRRSEHARERGYLPVLFKLLRPDLSSKSDLLAGVPRTWPHAEALQTLWSRGSGL